MPVAADAGAGRRATPPMVRVWDPLVRVGHWLLVTGFFVAYLTEDDLLTLHSWTGYIVAAYVVIRVLWGFAGPGHARFADFAYGPVRAARYLFQLLRFRSPRYLGHSPAGAMMVFALLLTLAATSVSGMALLAVEENAGPLAPWLGRTAAVEGSRPVLSGVAVIGRAWADDQERDDERDGADGRKRGKNESKVLEEVHEVIANLTLLLVLFHVGGVNLASVAHRENLVAAMFSGRKRAE